MLTYDISKRGKTPSYKYLYHCIKEDILGGNIAPDEKLPSKRSFARHLNLSVVTVMSAYDMLIAEGYIYTKPKKGYYVIPIKAQTIGERPSPEPVLQNNSQIYFDFSSHSVNGDKFPFSIWSRLMRKTLLDYDNELLNPLPYNGAEILRSAICRYLFHHSGMNISPEQIIIGAGTEYLYSLIIHLLGKDKTYAVENPGYSKIPRIYKMNGVKTEYINMDGKGLSVKELRRGKADVVHISPNHHYPTGIIMPIDRRHEILNWADETNSYIIEDDYDSEFRAYGPVENLYTIDKNQRVIYLNTFSRTIAPSIRISYLILPRHLLKIYREKMNFLSCTVSGFEQYTLSAFINDGYFERHLARMKKYYENLEITVKNFLAESEIKDKIKILENKSGLHFLLKIDTKKSDSQLREEMNKIGLDGKFLSMYMHCRDVKTEHYLIVNYSGFDVEKMKIALGDLSKLL